MDIGRILPGIAIISGRIFVCGGEVDSQILANGEVGRFFSIANSMIKFIHFDTLEKSFRPTLEIYQNHAKLLFLMLILFSGIRAGWGLLDPHSLNDGA